MVGTFRWDAQLERLDTLLAQAAGPPRPAPPAVKRERAADR